MSYFSFFKTPSFYALALIFFFVNLALANVTSNQKNLVPARTKIIGNPAGVKLEKNKVIVFVWDGLRPDVINNQNTPNLHRLKIAGTNFTDHHSSFPTVTMNNANSLATGNYSGQTGFYGNKIWRPDLIPFNKNFEQPVVAKSNSILKEMDDQVHGRPLMYVETLLQIARKQGLTTAQIGKRGPIDLQDANKRNANGIVLTNEVVYPESFAKYLYSKNFLLPTNIMNNYRDQEFKETGVRPKAGKDPFEKNTKSELKTLDGQILLAGLSDPSADNLDLNSSGNAYLMEVFTTVILEKYQPDLSIIWFPEPDATAHTYGSGSKPYYTALKKQDEQLGILLKKLEMLDIGNEVNLLVLSDHGHSNVSGDLNSYPLRAIKNGNISSIDSKGYSVSGNIRVAEVLSKAGFNAYDGKGCKYDPVLDGIYSDNTLNHAINVDKSGRICKNGKNALYTTKSYFLPKKLPKDSIIVTNNSGSVYLYLPNKNQALVTKLVRFLQSKLEFDSIFVDSNYGDLPGTLPMSAIKFNDDSQSRNPDVLVSLSYDDTQMVQGLPGTIHTSSDLKRGAHGSLSPIDIHNVLIAYGPNFKMNFQDKLPTANIDVPLTIAQILDLPMSNRIGRPLLEALVGSGVSSDDYNLKFVKIQPSSPAVKLLISGVDKNKKVVLGVNNYTFALNVKQLYFQNSRYDYLDSGRALRY